MRVVIDGTNVLYRSHHALSRSGLTHAGRPVWALHGLLTTMTRFVKEERPTHLLVAFDSIGGCPARRSLQPSYKATRTPPVADLAYQLDWAPSLLSQLSLGTWRLADWEADDGLASAAWSAAPDPVVVVTSDRDAYQLISDRVAVVTPDGTRVTDAWVQQKYGVPASGYAHMAALRGETSDNLPGISGIGEKTASALVARFGTVDAVLQATDGELRAVVGPKQLTALRQEGDLSRLTFAVGVLRSDLPCSWQEAVLSTVDTGLLAETAAQLGLPRAGEQLAQAIESLRS